MTVETAVEELAEIEEPAETAVELQSCSVEILRYFLREFAGAGSEFGLISHPVEDEAGKIAAVL